LLHSCAELREPIKLSFGVVTGVGSGIDALDGSSRAPKGRGSFGDSSAFVPHWFEGAECRIFRKKCIRLVREKLTVFMFGKILLESTLHSLSEDVSGLKLKWGTIFAKM